MFWFFKKKPKPLIFIGGRSGFDLLTEICQLRDIKVIGCLDQYYYGNTDQIKDVPIIGSELELIDNPRKYKDAKFFIGTGWDGNSRFGKSDENGYHLRLKRLNLIKSLGLECHNLIDPDARIGRNTVLGQGIHIGRWVSIRDHVTIGNHCTMLDLSIVGEETKISDNVLISAHAFVSGKVTIGKNVYIGSNATIAKGRYDENIELGDDVKVHAHAAVYKSIPAGKTATFTGKVIGRIDL